MLYKFLIRTAVERLAAPVIFAYVDVRCALIERVFLKYVMQSVWEKTGNIVTAEPLDRHSEAERISIINISLEIYFRANEVVERLTARLETTFSNSVSVPLAKEDGYSYKKNSDVIVIEN